MDRGTLGTMRRADARESEDYLEFVEGLRVFNTKALTPLLRPRGDAAAAAFESRAGRRFESAEEITATLNQVPLFATRSRLWRTSQDMAWEAIVAAHRSRETALIAELEAAERRGPGTLSWDPAFAYPAYFTAHAFHIQPGNYHGDPLAGYLYHYGTKVLFMGRNDRDDLQRDYVALCPVPADGVVRRVLDLGCSLGQSTTALKGRFPNAEVWGIDIAAPMVRYAHMRASNLGSAVHFAQRAAEDTGFASGSFDLVYSYILFHEIPAEVAQRVCREAARLLRPGGVHVMLDVPNAAWDPSRAVNEYLHNFVTRDNGEPYRMEFLRTDWQAMSREAGFSSAGDAAVGESTAGLGGIPVRVATR